MRQNDRIPKSGKYIYWLEQVQKISREEGKLLLNLDAEINGNKPFGVFDNVTQNLWDKFLLPEKRLNTRLHQSLDVIFKDFFIFETHATIYSQPKKVVRTAYQIKKEADESLLLLRTTGESHYADTFRELLLEYKSAFFKYLRQVTSLLICSKKIPLKVIFTDFRSLVRRLLKLISRNVDDENSLINYSTIKTLVKLITRKTNHEHRDISYYN